MHLIAKVTFAVWLGLSSVAFYGCQSDVQPRLALYHWQGQWAPNEAMRTWAEGLGPTWWYVRFFDLDLSADGRDVEPISQLSWTAPLPDTLAAVVFITTRALEVVPQHTLATLASRMYRLLDTMAQAAGVQLAEVQLDCDWTPSLRAKYFKLLSAFQQILSPHIVLSATIRLHQVKWAARTGVPPVDKGMLMVYHTGDVRRRGVRNAILQTEVLKQYLYGFDTYPLPLDVVWPLFSWGVLWREGRFIRLISPLSAQDLADSSRFASSDKLHFSVRRATWLKGYYLYSGDSIRLERVPFDTLQQAAAILADALARTPTRVAFYHFDTTVPQLWTHDQLYQILETTAR